MDITVIVPTLNEEKSIESCLKSIRSQDTSHDYEIIVSDSGSRDRTTEIAEKYVDKIVASRKGIAPARNTGAEHARGDFLVFIDADTIIPKNYLEKVMEKFTADPGLLAFSAGFTFSNRDNRLIFIEKIINSYFVFRGMVGLAILPGFNTAIRRHVFESAGGFRDVPIEDGEFAFRLRKLGKTDYFTDFYVITSSRRLEKMGLLGTIRYYLDMDLATRDSRLSKFLTYANYTSCRIDEPMLHKEFSRISECTSDAEIDLTIQNYIQKKTDELFEVAGVKRIGQFTREQFLKWIINVSESIAELKLITKVNRRDVDRAIELINEKVKLKRSD